MHYFRSCKQLKMDQCLMSPNWSQSSFLRPRSYSNKVGHSNFPQTPASPPTTPHISPALKPARRFSRPGGAGGVLEFWMLDVGCWMLDNPRSFRGRSVDFRPEARKPRVCFYGLNARGPLGDRFCAGGVEGRRPPRHLRWQNGLLFF